MRPPPNTKGRTGMDAGLSVDQAWSLISAVRDYQRAHPDETGPLGAALGRDGRVAIAPAERGSDDLVIERGGRWSIRGLVPTESAELFDLYLPLARPTAGSLFVLGQIGQSLDGRIATLSGDSMYVNGSTGIVHLHRLRALVDGVLVGAGTVQSDNPLLTVRHCPGLSPRRFVLDTNRRLAPTFRVFDGSGPPTTVFCAAATDAPGETRLGAAEVVTLPRDGDWLDGRALLAAVAQRGVTSLLVEGGGVTVSRFLAAGLLDRLHIAIAPLIIGSGRPGIVLPPVDALAKALRPPMRRFHLGDDTLFDCLLRH